MKTESTHSIGEIGHCTHARFPVSIIMSALLKSTQDAVASKTPEALVIGTHTKIPLLGEGLLQSEYPHALRKSVVDSPPEVLDRLRVMVHHLYRRFTVVVAAFELHHFHGQALEDALNLLQMLSRGTVVIGDYTLGGTDAESMREGLQSRSEVLQQEIYGGYREWFQSHNVFTPRSFAASMNIPAWKSFHTFSFPGQTKMVAVGSGTMDEGTMQGIVHNANLGTMY